jgi:hypothetical protein
VVDDLPEGRGARATRMVNGMHDKGSHEHISCRLSPVRTKKRERVGRIPRLT